MQPAPATVTAPPVATRLAGRLSVRPGSASVSAEPLGLVSTIESVLSAPGATALGAKDLATVTLVKSVALAAAGLLTFWSSVRARAGIVFVYEPAAVSFTLTVTVHEVTAPKVAPESVKPVPPGTAVTLPPQVVAAPGVAAFTMPAGYASTRPPPVSAVALGLVTVTVSRLAAPTSTAPGLNAFAIVGAASTVTSSLAVEAAL